MEFVKILVGVVLPYMALVVFVAGMIYRINSWKKLASPSMTLFPAPPTSGENTINMLKEVALFKSLFHGDRVLWVLAWSFHVVLALIFVGHFRVFTGLVDAMLGVFMSTEAIQAMSGGAGGAAGVLILAALILLLVRRMTLQRAQEVTGPADYLALLLLGVIVFTGNMMRFSAHHFDLTLTHEYFAALATFSVSTSQAALQNNVFLVHLCLALVLIMAIPFSKILHLGGIFFTHQLIRKQ
ncbi:MAG: respiratory nitrate reductase subunit gamma [Planctomycetes bacterium]|nr:respiratory nitrate reductase subunit gamma [Planctomycetota bacterium]